VCNIAAPIQKYYHLLISYLRSSLTYHTVMTHFLNVSKYPMT